MLGMLVATNACLIGVPRATCQEAEAVRDIRDGARQLFLDDWLIANATNVERVQGSPSKHPNNPIIRRDKPWDRGRADLYGNAVYDPENDRIQLFYAANSAFEGHEDRLAYAESRDGGDTWIKPELGLIPFDGARNTNLVLLPPSQTMHGPCVFRDEHETDPAKRYKLFTASYPDTAYLGIPRIYEHRGPYLYATEDARVPEGCDLPGLFVAYSPDGIHWPTPPVRVSDMLSDTTQRAFWDARIQRYVAYIRARTANDRSVARMESADFETWTEPEVVLEGTPEQSIYSMGVTQYEGLYVGTPWIFDRGSEASGGPVIWPELAVSRDGKSWSRPWPGQPLIPNGPAGSGDSKQIRMSASLVVLDDKILLFYGQTDRPHVVDMRVEIGAATLRLDGMAAMRAGDAEGTILTKPLRFNRGRLHVNASVDPGGYVKAELLRDGTVVRGYDLARSRPVTTDSLSARLVWKNRGAVPGTDEGDWRIRFALKDASLYSFRIEPVVSGN